MADITKMKLLSLFIAALSLPFLIGASLHFPITYNSQSDFFVTPPIPTGTYAYPQITQLVAFHVIHQTNGTGMLTQSVINQQIAELNYAFSGQEAKAKKYGSPTDAKITFVLSSVDYTENDDWYNNCALFNYQPTIKQALAINPALHYNVYTCHATTSLGLSIIPYMTINIFGVGTMIPPESHWMLGTILDSGLLPGSTTFNGRWSTGSILVHEAGHNYGLQHIYQGGCVLTESYSDNILDTPRQNGNPSESCPAMKGTRSCPKLKQPPDDYSDYMSINFGSCVSHFTPGQVLFIRNAINVLKPTLAKQTQSSTNGSQTTCARYI